MAPLSRVAHSVAHQWGYFHIYFIPPKSSYMSFHEAILVIPIHPLEPHTLIIVPIKSDL